MNGSHRFESIADNRRINYKKHILHQQSIMTK